MAALSRRVDGGFFVRINVGGISTKQVHPDAVRFLNKRNVYVGDVIPSDMMRTLKSQKNWLYTKEEFPLIQFNEHRDPTFGLRIKASKPSTTPPKSKKAGIGNPGLGIVVPTSAKTTGGGSRSSAGSKSGPVKTASNAGVPRKPAFNQSIQIPSSQRQSVVGGPPAQEIQNFPKGRRKNRQSRSKLIAGLNYSVQGGTESKADSRRRNDLFEAQRVEKFRAQQAALVVVAPGGSKDVTTPKQASSEKTTRDIMMTASPLAILPSPEIGMEQETVEAFREGTEPAVADSGQPEKQARWTQADRAGANPMTHPEDAAFVGNVWFWVLVVALMVIVVWGLLEIF